MWTGRDSIRVATAAVAAFGMTLALFWTRPSQAVGEAVSLQMIATPTFRVGACEVTAGIAKTENVQAIKGSQVILSPGKVPAVSLVVHNTSDKAAHAQFDVSLPALMLERMSRVLRPVSADSQISQTPAPGPNAAAAQVVQKIDLTLDPNETRTVEISRPELNLVLGNSVMLIVNDPEKRGGTILLQMTAAPAQPPERTTAANISNALPTR